MERLDSNLEYKQLSLFDLLPTEKSEEFLLDSDSTCKILSISKATLNNWVKLDKIKYIKSESGGILFQKNDVYALNKSLLSGNVERLSSRRNKSKFSRSVLYANYIYDLENIKVVNHLIESNQYAFDIDLIRIFLAYTALQFYLDKNLIPYSGSPLLHFVNEKPELGDFAQLIDDLLPDNFESKIDLNSSLFNTRFKYVPNEDTLGFIYLSLNNIGKRKSSGTYYTPLKTVDKMLQRLSGFTEMTQKKILDPSCGSGNFLLRVSDKTNSFRNIYGIDIDPIAIHLVRINFALKYPDCPITVLYNNFRCDDTLLYSTQKKFDIIVGNPPWGATIAKNKMYNIQKNYFTAKEKGTETFSLFLEKGIRLLDNKGFISFVLPESILNVASHENIREYILSSCNLIFNDYLGCAFSGVNTPVIVLGLQKSTDKNPGIEKVFYKEKIYRIHTNRQISPKSFSFNITDEAQDVIAEIESIESPLYLKDNAIFALGIVTGNNKALISDTKTDANEMILRGSNLKKFCFEESGSYIEFTPNLFQQVAPTEIYRAKEKLLYRFISKCLVFSYDNKQTLSLNSANIVIPTFSNLSIKYVLAILNSSVINFFYMKKFNSIKVLRQHLESLPIPRPSSEDENTIVRLVDCILKDKENYYDHYNLLDKKIANLYGLKQGSLEFILSELAEENQFHPL